MARHTRRAADLGFDAIQIEGALIAPDMIARIAATERNAKTAADYDCPKGTNLGDEIARYFRIGQAHWQTFAKIESPTVTQTAGFASMLLGEAFGFDDLVGPVEHRDDGRRFRIALEARQGRVPIVCAAPLPDGDGFAKALPEFGDSEGGRARRSPTVLLQDWLNANPDFYWGMVFAGDRVRLMRDNASLTRPAWIEADLGAIFRDEMFADFTALWLLTHATRFGAAGTPPSSAPLEKWREEGLKQGTAARARLREGVEEALRELGQGLVSANSEVRARIERNELSIDAVFEELLRTVYRLIFLAVAEDRDLLHPPGTSRSARDLYAGNYGFAYWRERSARRTAYDAHHDAWEGMKIVLAALEPGQPTLGLPALGGLFGNGTTPLMSAARLPNRQFLMAIYRLGFLQVESRRTRINWRDMKTEELGSVYEGLLEIRPILRPNGDFVLDSGAKGNARKTSGSYYTPDSLVETLLDSALDPVLDRAEAEGGEDAILDLKLIDPAIGSGHFMLGAARRMADRVARLRDPDAPDTQAALRDVVGRCIYGVDRNPMAVELAKVALWIESVSPGAPLGFLDANIRCGDALLGVFNLDALQDGIPDDAYKPLKGDHAATSSGLKRLNRSERDSGLLKLAIAPQKLVNAFDRLHAMPEATVTEIRAKERAYRAIHGDPDWWSVRQACDAYMAAFLLTNPKLPDATTKANVPTTRHVREALDRHPPQGALAVAIDTAASQARVFHWPVEFPDVMIGRGGFDVVLGNPPWDTMSPDLKEFFSGLDPEIRFLSPEDQKQRLAELLVDQSLAEAWEREQDRLYRAANFMRNSGRYALFAEGSLGKGDFNVYRMFVEFALRAIRADGVAAQIVPENFYNGANAAALRAFILAETRLLALIAFENTKRVWFDIDSRQKFCLYVAYQGGSTEIVPAAFGINSEPKLASLAKPLPFQIPLSLIRELSPVALAIPEFGDPLDVSIARKLHGRLPSFGAALGNANDRVYMREIDMGNDRDTFGDHVDGVPLFEGRMVEPFDYRAKAYVSGRGRQAVWKDLPFGSSEKRITPQWRISQEEIPDKARGRANSYRLGFCDVGGVTNQRFLMATMIPPRSLCGHSVPTILFEPSDDRLSLFWLGLANSFCLDFLARQKGALHMTLTLVDSLPLPRRFTGTPIEFAIASHVALLACSGPEMAGLWDRVEPWVAGGSAPADEPPMRRRLRAELDVYVARDFFGLSKDEMRYLLDPSSVLPDDCGIETFGALKRSEMRAQGRFTTFDMIMDAWDNLDVPT